MIKPEIVDVTDELVLLRVTGSEFNQGNVSCIVMEDGLVFVDMGQNLDLVARFRKKMEERFKKKASFVLLTHMHWDHLLAQDVFRDVPIISSQNGVDAIKKELENELSPEGRKKVVEDTKKWMEEQGATPSKEREDWWEMLPTVRVVPPTIGVKDEITFESNGRKFRYQVVGGHSDCSSYIHCETDNILITGDNLVVQHAANSPCMLAGFNPKCIEILEHFERMNVDRYVPGHGPVVGVEYVTKSREWFTSMFDALRELKSNEIPMEKAISDPSLPDFFEEERPRQWERIVEFWYKAV
ncbi:MAG: MBL fold metallo-hydrolase [Candidatus Thorarchaeota archaeon]